MEIEYAPEYARNALVLYDDDFDNSAELILNFAKKNQATIYISHILYVVVRCASGRKKLCQAGTLRILRERGLLREWLRGKEFFHRSISHDRFS